MRLRAVAVHRGPDALLVPKLEELILVADSCLYQCKHEGRDRATIGTVPINHQEPNQ